MQVPKSMIAPDSGLPVIEKSEPLPSNMKPVLAGNGAAKAKPVAPFVFSRIP
jgi:hypothetical protein